MSDEPPRKQVSTTTVVIWVAVGGIALWYILTGVIGTVTG